MRKFIKIIGWVLLFIAFFTAFFMFVSTFFGIDKYLVVSGSMEPELYAGDIAIVNRNVEFQDVEIGDIIIFRYNDMNIIHRVIDETVIDGEKYLKTKGDANKCDDGYLTATDNYLGTTLFHIPKVFGFMVDFYNLIYK
ncbi:MAG: signal peptidase I [Acutalibacteraceae bacterium]|nr:signal peptidase I [Acutalibacteraceae bacterium]